jgi:hypothetical protein
MMRRSFGPAILTVTAMGAPGAWAGGVPTAVLDEVVVTGPIVTQHSGEGKADQ